jgi:dimethylglycine dehydrogenase
VRGPGATAFLDWFTCNKLPNVGRINLTYALTDHGTTRTEYTIVRLAEDEYYLISAGAWTAYDADFLQKAADDWMGGRVRPHRHPRRDHPMGRLRAGRPEAARILKEIVKDADPDTVLWQQALPLAVLARDIELGMCPVRAIRVAYTGELGWELHHPIEMQPLPLGPALAAGEKHGLKPSARGRRTGCGRKNPTAPSATSLAATRPRWRRARPLRGPDQGLPRQGGDAGHRHPVEMRDLLIDGPATPTPGARRR